MNNIDKKHSEEVHLYSRELAWIKFNFRVLLEGKRPTNPLLERIKFLSISATNLDEFVEIRIAKLEQKRHLEEHKKEVEFLLKKIYHFISLMYREMYSTWQREILPSLEENQIFLLEYSQLDFDQKEYVDNIFTTEYQNILTLFRVNREDAVPLVLNKVLCFAILAQEENSSAEYLILVSIPRILPRLIKIPNKKGQKSGETFILLSEVLRDNVKRLLPKDSVQELVVFRVTRNSNLYFNEEEISDILNAVELELHNRAKGDAVRLEIHKNVSLKLLLLLQKYFNLQEQQVMKVDYPVNFPRIAAFYDLLDRPKLKYKQFIPKEVSLGGNIFETISKKDILLHHPYESFTPIIMFLQVAADDPDVVAIKMTLYRVTKNSPIVEALILAAHNGKDVTVVLELQARFDEESNISWAKKLLEAGAIVLYGTVGMKTHCKVTAVSRLENNNIITYCHIGTGNYNEKTSQLYTDLSLFTRKEKITKDVLTLFHGLTSKNNNINFHHLLVAPYNMLSTFIKAIENEIKAVKNGKQGLIIFKLNSLQDKEVIEVLHKAAVAGVTILGIVRGACCYKFNKSIFPNVRIISIIGRFLEHSRIYYFKNHEPYSLYMGSADWMPRNLRRRIEVVVPIIDKDIQDRILHEILAFPLKDNFNSMELRTFFSYPAVKTEEYFSAQDEFMNLAKL